MSNGMRSCAQGVRKAEQSHYIHPKYLCPLKVDGLRRVLMRGLTTRRFLAPFAILWIMGLLLMFTLTASAVNQPSSLQFISINSNFESSPQAACNDCFSAVNSVPNGNYDHWSNTLSIRYFPPNNPNWQYYQYEVVRILCKSFYTWSGGALWTR